jgi:acetyl esterase/lipase
MVQRVLLPATLLLACAVYLAAQQDSYLPSSSTPPAAASSETSHEVSVRQDVEYGVQGGQELLLDIYLPTEKSPKPRPAVVLIHGGSWTSFDKGTMARMVNFLARSGFVAVSVNYRLLHDRENRGPAQLDDVQRAVRWLRANASKYDIDPDHIGAFGHSAGAQLAALLGMEDTRDNSDPALAKYSSRVQAVVDVSGPSDFVAKRNADSDAAMANLFGESYAKAPAVWRSASPSLT